MNIGKQLQLTIFLFAVSLPLLVMAASFDCNGNECCRTSQVFGLSSCEGGLEPRIVIAAFEVPERMHTHTKTLDDLIAPSLIQGRYGVLAPDKRLQDGGNKSLLHSMVFGAILSVLVYHMILASKQTHLVKLTAVLSILMIMAFGPCFYFTLLNIQNSAVRFPLCLNAFLFVLRTLEAYFGFTPKGATKSYWMYCIYFVFPAEIIFDARTEKPVKATRSDALQSFWMIIYTFVFNTLLLSFLCHTDYLPFGSTKASRFDSGATLINYFNPRHLGNCFFLGLWFQQTLVWGTSIVEFILQAIFGWKCMPMMANPLFRSTKPSDFWSKRWNAVVHALLKRGVYKPARQWYSALTSSVIVFAVSGIMHEWLVYIGFKYDRIDIEGASYNPSNILFGTNFLFFFYGFAPVAVEKFLGKFTTMKQIGAVLPHPVKTCIVLMTSLPFAFWFIDPYLQGRMFLDYEGLGFTIFKMK